MTVGTQPCRIVVLLSGSGSNLQAILDFFREKSSAEVVAVLSNRADAGGLQRAGQAGIPTAVLSHGDFPNREDFDAALAAQIDSFHPQLVVLAGFMRILTPGFVRQYQGRMMNIHPSLLPRHRGLNTHQRALDARDTVHGATVHFVTEELDGGPAILQARIPVYPEDSAAQLAERVLLREHRIYPQAIEWFCEGRLQWRDHAVWFDGRQLQEPIRTSDS